MRGDDGWSIATTAAAGFSGVTGAPAFDASLPAACVAGVCTLTDFAHFDLLISEKLVKLTLAVKIMLKFVQKGG